MGSRLTQAVAPTAAAPDGHEDQGRTAAPAAIFTIVSANYIAFAATLMQSVRQFHPDVARYIILSDAMHSFGEVDLAAEVVACDELGIHLLGNMKLWYSVIEFNTAVKPFTFEYLFTERGFQKVIYLDPDTQLYAPLDEVFNGLIEHSLVLTPHMTRPLQDGKHPSDLSIMKSGVYNLGFTAIRNDTDGRALVRWWCERLFAHCRVDVPGNMFTDQRWMDLSPVFVERPFLLRHPGYNVAYWNLVHRTVVRDDEGRWLVNGLPLAFFHFSGIKPEDPTVFSKHQDRFTIETLGPVAQLCDEYRARVLANGWLTHNKIAYAYAKFGDGRSILDGMRRWILRAIDDGRLNPNRPLRLGSVYFDTAAEDRFAGGGQLTRFAHQLWIDRPDLQAAFNIHQPDGFESYLNWFCGESAEREDVPSSLIVAMRRLRAGVSPEEADKIPQPVQPPWPPLAQQSWQGAAKDAAEWLRGEVRFTLGRTKMRLQRQAALLWERRIDLQRHFPLITAGDLEQYELWVLTTGVQEGSIQVDLFSADYVAWFDSPSSVAQIYEDVPTTQGMTLTRLCSQARDGLHAWPGFPVDPQARFEHAFWFAFVAPKVFGWSPAMTTTVRAFMNEPSGVQLRDYSFSRGMVAIYSMRADLHEQFDLGDEAGQWAYLRWLILQGTREMRLDPLDLCPGLAGFFATASERFPLLTRIAEFAYDTRDDLRTVFDLNLLTDVTAMSVWMVGELEPWLQSLGLAGLLGPVLPMAASGLPPHRCTVALAGDWNVTSGIGEDLRTAVAALDANGFGDYVIVDFPSNSLIGADRATLPQGTPVEAAWTVMFHNADTAMVDWQALRRLRVTSDRTAAHWLWELERIPARWRYAFSFCDEIWASSRFVADIFEAEKLRPVHLLHHAVITPVISEPLQRRRLGLDDQATLFLFMFDFGSHAARKNPHAVIRAFMQAFPEGSERVQLVIKSQNASLRPALWAELAGLTDDPRVVIKDTRLSRADLNGLLASSDAFVSLHRSEGFGRGPAEAMLLGLPVILTGYSGTADFTDPKCACIVGYTMVPVRPGDYPGVEGQRWAEANVDEAGRYMRWVHEQPKAAKRLGKAGRKRAQAMLAPDVIGRAIVGLLHPPSL